MIQDKLHGQDMHACLAHYAESMIPTREDRKDFIEDVLEDLEHIDPIRLAGLGITWDQVLEWKNRGSMSFDTE